MLLVGIGLYSREKKELPEDFVTLILPGDPEREIRIWSLDGEDYYAVLPSFADRETVRVRVQPGAEILLNGQPVTDGTACLPEIGQTCDLSCRYRRSGQDARFTLLQSADVMSMFVDTPSGTLDKVYTEKDDLTIKGKDRATISTVFPDGTEGYSGDGADEIRGRGNSTAYGKKKPFRLSLTTEADLIGAGSKATDWVLLANAYDSSNLRTELVFKTARETGIGWTPDCVFTDLYLNGCYNGLYLLTEVAEFGEGRLQTEGAEDAFLLKVDHSEDEGPTFTTKAKQPVFFESPKKITVNYKEMVRSVVQNAEDLILNGLDDDAWQEALDTDTWVFRYLTDEIFENIDSGAYSSLFYGLKKDGKTVLYGGPLWDFDMCWGNPYMSGRQSINPETMFATRQWKYINERTPYYGALMKKTSFRQRVVEIYRDVYRPLLEELVREKIDASAGQISEAAACNSIRWGWYSEQEGNHFSEAVDNMRTYLEKRIAFLDRVLLNGEKVCIVQILPTKKSYPSTYRSVPEGTVFTDLPEGEWMDWITGKDFDPTQPVLEDVYLVPKGIEEETEVEPPTFSESLQSSGIFRTVILSCGAFLLVFAVVLVVNRRRR